MIVEMFQNKWRIKVKKIISITVALAVLVSLMIGGTALAADPSTVTTTWSGSGEVWVDSNTGDSEAHIYTGGNSIIGSFVVTDSNDNPYNYGVDTNQFALEASVVDGGEIEYLVQRNESKISMYGVAGQQSYAYVFSSDGEATLQNRSTTNYASMRDCNYGWHSNDHIVVNGSYWTLTRGASSGTGNIATLTAEGDGSAELDCMSSEASAGQVRLGWGCGCYTNADFSATGAGTFELSANGNNSTTTALAPGMTGATSFDIVASWTSSFNINDYSVTAN